MAEKKRRRWLRVLIYVAIAILALLTIVVVAAAPMAGGYVSKISCSEVFVAKRQLDSVLAADLKPYGFVSVAIDKEAQTSTASLFGLYEVMAVHREGLGCAIAVDSDPETIRAQGFDPARIDSPLDDLPWPQGSKANDGVIEGLNRDALGSAIEGAFLEPNPDELRRTRALVVVWNGELVAERYGDSFDKNSRLLGWSMTKSVTSALIGAAQHQGLLSKTDTAGFDEWQGDTRKNITIDQLLRMSSGLSFNEQYVPLTDATEMLFESEDTANAAVQHERDQDPDSVWSYSSATTNLLSKILRTRIGDGEKYHRFPYEVLFAPLGMHSARIEADASGTFVGSSFMYATAQDWARFGLLYAQDGVYDGERILPEGWVEYTRTPTKPAPQGQYGAQFWLNAGTEGKPQDRRFPALPPDSYFASGFQGQTVMVIPSRDAIIVRLGMTHKRGAFPLEDVVKEILDALPHRKPEPAGSSDVSEPVAPETDEPAIE